MTRPLDSLCVGIIEAKFGDACREYKKKTWF